MSKTYYTKKHEWIMVEDGVGTIGITDHAQEQLGDIVFVELPDPGLDVEQGDEACVVESVKAASEVYAPISGEVVEANEALGDNAALVNESAEADAWFIKIKLSNTDELEELMDKAGYEEFVESES
ncbi:MAG: glycine cleavage system protein GcvH [bacterium]|nr:glycine cleavage system protein GcvH [bacterium]